MREIFYLFFCFFAFLFEHKFIKFVSEVRLCHSEDVLEEDSEGLDSEGLEDSEGLGESIGEEDCDNNKKEEIL